MALDRHVDQDLDVRLVLHVGGAEDELRPVKLRHGLAASGLQIPHHHLGAFLDEALHTCFPDTACPAGYHRDLACQPSHFRCALHQ